jgi:hypothetical protein
MMTKQRADLTYKDNLRRGRHGWVRLTPAYSVKIVHQILDEHPDIQYILEPFSGTGTTGLVAGQKGLKCDLYDINPFLIWLANVKCANYTEKQLEDTRSIAEEIVQMARSLDLEDDELWMPPISNIERWWAADRLLTLSRIYYSLNHILNDTGAEKNLLLVSFCRLIIQWSNAAFNHQSMSFKHEGKQKRLFDEEDEIFRVFLNDTNEILSGASETISGTVRTFNCDSRDLVLDNDVKYDAVITSPPYVNRMSYIRELRPYMFWLGYLEKARDAGELDWDAIGGTWGIATSRLNDWTPNGDSDNIPHLRPIVSKIAETSDVLSRYVHRYFVDMSRHFSSLRDVVAPGGQLFYIIGNSKFYDTVVPAEQIYADLMRSNGFGDVHIKKIRKRNSKKELFEYLVTARRITP